MDTIRAPRAAGPIVSYAQNHEDILLWRAFSGVSAGFYVDVGANSPNDSITALFYEGGWRGINVEPVASWFEMLERERPEDTNLNICLSDSNDPVELVEVVDTGLTTSDLDLAEKYAEKWETRRIRRPARRLREILSEHARSEIHFLSIDVEGMEARVLAGADFQVHRPRVVIVESVHPVTHEPTHRAWEPDLLAAGYALLSFDGVNRFYGAEERLAELTQHFATPPNSTDDFISRTERDAHRVSQERGDALHHLSQLHHDTRQELDDTHERLLAELDLSSLLRSQVSELEERLSNGERHLRELLESASWRATAPLRAVAGRLRSARTFRR